MRTSSWAARLWVLNILVLAVTGFGQMPLYNRYYLTSVPGLSWLGDFGLTHAIHYIAAAVFLAQVCYWMGNILFARGWRLTSTGLLRVLAIAVLVGTGVVRVAKNDPDIWFSPTTVMLVDWTHIAATILFGVFALAAGILFDASRGAPDAQGMPACGLRAGLVRGAGEPARHTLRIRRRPTDDVDEGAGADPEVGLVGL